MARMVICFVVLSMAAVTTHGRALAEVCTTGQFQCDNGGCVFLAFVNDGDNDCGDYSDETVRACTAEEFLCDNGQCVALRLVHDGTNDCGDASDERGYSCDHHTQFTCTNQRCVDVAYYCDGDNDCGDGSDEAYCEETVVET